MTRAISPHKKDDARRIRVFISYKRGIEPDESVALKVYEALKQLRHEVFIDSIMPVGSHWALRIEEELSHADFLIAFLSSESTRSEMVVAEVETAYQLAKQRGERPTILPVRLAYQEPLKYPLSAYLNHINWASWQSPDDTSRLIEELSQAISGGAPATGRQEQSVTPTVASAQLSEPLPTAQPIPLELPDGTIDTQSAFYVERQADQIALDAIQRQGVTITIKAPRQMGKSSLLRRVTDAGARAGKQIAFLDFQLFDRAALAEPRIFFQQFCSWISDKVEVENRVEEYWKTPLGNSYCCTRYVSHYLMEELSAPLVLAMDEVESIFDASFRSDFFGMLRSWHNERRVGSIWKHVDLALVTSTEPYQFVDNLNQSPFNVGEVVELTDFTPDQVADLNRRHRSPLSPQQEKDLMALVGGHPYLIRRALYLVANERMSAADLFNHAAEDRGPFGDHLRHHLFRLGKSQALLEGLAQIIRHQKCHDEQVYFRLHGAGLVRRVDQGVMPRYRLYADFFRGRLHV
jgi:AAA domain-containing protein/TIR domain-containing protein